VEFTCLADLKCELGESPVWDDRRELLFFVDILAPALHAIRLDGSGLRTWPMPAVIGSVGLTQTGRLIAALKHDLALFDPESGSLQPFTRLPSDEPRSTRLNDGKVGPDGAFWVGTMHDVPEREPIGALYRVAPDGSVTRYVEGLKVSNGLAFSPDGTAMYHADTRSFWLDRWDFSAATGTISGRTRIHEFDGGIGLPDGGATDTEGCYWSAGIYGGRINRFNPDGELLDSLDFPVPAPTMPCFCGPDLRFIAVTSHRTGSIAAQLDRFPQSGGIFIARAPVSGALVGRMGTL
jgi:sugar lactone lactonase YvrE